jgi:ribosomal protein S12 methylthiotransferase accessory factor
MEAFHKAGKLTDLFQPSGGGLVQRVSYCEPYSDEPQLITAIASLGNMEALWPEISKTSGRGKTFEGVGVGLTREEALIPALAESLERYCVTVFRHDQFIWATAKELNKDALDLDSIPRCSQIELSHPKCPLILPDKAKSIRWVQGISLLDGRLVYLPAIMVFLHAGFATDSERFWLPLSTGCAAHRSYESALVSAIYEVVERDAISIIWLQKLPLPRIEIEYPCDTVAPYWNAYRTSSASIDYLFFDATTDLGIPTVYGLQILRQRNDIRTLVSCSTSATMADALAKVLRDMASTRVAFRSARPVPDAWDDFTDMFHGATYMARPENASAFHFLSESGEKKRLVETPPPSLTSETELLHSVVDMLRRKHLDAYAVDLSTDEAFRVGMRVVRVIIPGLQPLSFRYRAQYLGHSRVYQAPETMGLRALTERELNPMPQPFA